MSHFRFIELKLKHFLRKFYLNELIKGFLLFFVFFTLFFLTVTLIETFFWTSSAVRTVFFWALLLFSILLIIKFLWQPILILLKLKSGMTYNEASNFIGLNFPEVSDVLLNLVQLKQQGDNSELVLASIENKAAKVKHIPFQAAVDFKSNIKYLWFCLFPVLVYFFSVFSGYSNSIANGYYRIINYNETYVPPAPFSFNILNDSLETLNYKDFELKFSITGDFVPDNVKVVFNGSSYFVNELNSNTFSYKFSNVSQSIKFRLQGNSYLSKVYELNVFPSPRVFNLQSVINYPPYTKRVSDTISNNGSFTLLFGSHVDWLLDCESTDVIQFAFKDSLYDINNTNNVFKFSKQFFQPSNYTIKTSNKFVSNFESYNYKIDVIQDEYPFLKVLSKQDSLQPNSPLYFEGVTSDDYGIDEVTMVFYDSKKPDAKTAVNLSRTPGSILTFKTIFPDTILLSEDTSYKVFFKVKDNDPYDKNKYTYSELFTFNNISDSILISMMESKSESLLNQFSEEINKQQNIEKDLGLIKQSQDFKKAISYSDQQRIQQYIEKQKKSDEFFKKFTTHFKEQLESNPEQMNPNLKNRFEEHQKQLEKDKDLLNELNKLQSELNSEDLQRKLNQLSKSQKSKDRSLKQLLELTKQLVVQQQLNRLSTQLQDLANEQDNISKSDSLNKPNNQKKINDKYESLQSKLDSVQQKNEALKKPLKLDELNNSKDELSDALKKALEALSKNKSAESPQNNASKKMKEISDIINGALSTGGDSPNQEDADMLRQVLDNLITFSFDQEQLLNDFLSSSSEDSQFSKHLSKQQQLREHFQHIDDSLFALSLRQPKIGTLVNTSITDVFYYIDKSLSEFADSNFDYGARSQQYVITNTNTLSDFLSDVLDQMNNQLLMPGSGASDIPLPDIIMSQQQLKESLQQSSSKKEGSKSQDKNDSNAKESSNYYDIYKQQMDIKAQLESILKSKGLSLKQSDLENTFNKIEDALINRRSMNRAVYFQEQLQYKLIELQKATHSQSLEKKRTAATNFKAYNPTTIDTFSFNKSYLDAQDVLNKQKLPLQQFYKQIIQNYFNSL